MTDDPPHVPESALDGWTQTASQREQLFSFGGVSVTAATAVYEDASLRDELHDVASLDQPWRFFFASRLRIRPETGMGRALRRLVAERSKQGFTERLADRGFDDVRAVASRNLSVGDETASATRYEGTLRVNSVKIAVEGWLAVWPVGTQFRIAGGAYPTAVRSRDDPRTAALEDAFTPASFREELFTLIRAVE